MMQSHVLCIVLIFLSSWKFSPSSISGITLAEANWFANLPRIFFHNKRPSADALLKQKELETTVQTLRDEISQMKRQIVLYKQNVNSLRKERSELKQHYENLLKALEAKHIDEIKRIRSTLSEQQQESNEVLLQSLRDNFELEKQELLQELEKLHQEEKQELKQEILQLKSSSAEAIKTVDELKEQLKVSQEISEKSAKDFEKREGDYLKSVQELKEELAKKVTVAPPQPAPLSTTTSNTSSTAPPPATSAPEATPAPPVPVASPVPGKEKAASSSSPASRFPSHRRARTSSSTSSNPNTNYVPASTSAPSRKSK